MGVYLGLRMNEYLSNDRRLEIEVIASTVLDQVFGDDVDLPVELIAVTDYVGFRVEKFHPDREDNLTIAGFMSFNDKTIVLNANDSAKRRRFTCAHEVGHILLHEDHVREDGGDIVYRTEKLHDSENKTIEREANYFAGCLLMPKYLFTTEFDKNYGDIDSLSHLFGVSRNAVVIRISELNLNSH